MFSLRVLVSADKNMCTIIATVDSCVCVYVMSARKHFVVVGKNFVILCFFFQVYHSNLWPLEYTLAGREENACYCKLICNKLDKVRPPFLCFPETLAEVSEAREKEGLTSLCLPFISLCCARSLAPL